MKLVTMLGLLAVLGLTGCLSPQSGPPSVQPDVVIAGSSSSYAKSYKINFNGTGTFVWPMSGAKPCIMSVEMVFKDGGGVNTFDLDYTRDGIQRDLLISPTTAMRTLTWYVPRDKYPTQADIWQFSNTRSGAAVLTIDVFYK